MIVNTFNIRGMNINVDPSLEINEIIYHLHGEFWKQAYKSLLGKQMSYELVQDISYRQAINEFTKDIKILAKKNQLKYRVFSHKEHIYITLIPYPIYIGISRDTGDFSISAPHLITKHFSYSEYKRGINWIQDYIDIDTNPLKEKTKCVREKFYLNSKNSEIISTSIKVLCESILGKKDLNYELNQTLLRSKIMVDTKKNAVYEIEVYHKPFLNDVSLLIDLLNDLHEEKIEDVLSCELLYRYGTEIKGIVDLMKKVGEVVNAKF